VVVRARDGHELREARAFYSSVFEDEMGVLR